MKFSCSSFSWETKDGKHLLGRTYDDYGDLSQNSIIVVNRNHVLNLVCKGENIFETKYAFVGMGIKGLNHPIFVDGINEKGLMGALLRYPKFAKYDTQTQNNFDVNPAFFLSYTLGSCESIEEVCLKVKNLNLSGEGVFGNEIPVHFIFSDMTGESIIVEPDKSGITIHRNSIGVLANSPNYEWHEQNLRNYIGVTPSKISEQRFCDKDFDDFGFSGLDLPGGYSSVNRFSRVALLKNFALKGENEIDGITKMFHNFSSVDIPAGIVCKENNETINYQMTLCMSAMCSESTTYYFNLHSNRRICAVDLKKELNNTSMKIIDLPRDQDILFLN